MSLNDLRCQEISDRRLQQQESYNHRHKIGKDGDQSFIAMEFLDGATLR